MPKDTTPRPIDVLSRQLKDLQTEIKIMKCDIINLKEQMRIKDEKFEMVHKTQTEISTQKGWFF